MTTWLELRDEAERVLSDAAVDAAALEARWLIEEVSGYDLAELMARDAPVPSPRAASVLRDMLDRRAGGEPIQYVLGAWPFRGLELFLDSRVLIPRPETEITAQVALDEAARLGARPGAANPWSANRSSFMAADLGTGSGALALALASDLADAAIWATDISDDALAVASANLAGTGTAATRVRLVRGSWFDALPGELRGRLQLVVTNPPYVAESEVNTLPPEVRREPMSALVSGPTGLEAIDEIIASAPEWLRTPGVLVCELAPHQARHAVDAALATRFDEVLVRPDLSDRDRVLVARKLE